MGSLFNETEDDLPLRQRGREGAQTGKPRASSADREYTFSTGTVLAIFFALALLCAVFFAFGYSMGRKSGQAVVAANLPGADADAAASASASGPKPSATAAITSVPGYVGQGATGSATDRAKPDADKPSPAEAPAKIAPARTASPAPIVAAVAPLNPADAAPRPLPVKPTTVPVTHATAPAIAPSATAPMPPIVAPGAGSVYVQIVAVSHQEDANVVMAALRRRGYTVVQRSTSTDPLIHVQVGPFANKKDAEAMRQRLSGDGYNAILK